VLYLNRGDRWRNQSVIRGMQANIKCRTGLLTKGCNVILICVGRFCSDNRSHLTYRRVLAKGIYVPQNAVVLEISAGRGSWTRAPLKSMPTYVIHVVDFHDVAQWAGKVRRTAKMPCHQRQCRLSLFPDEYFDFCFSFGVLCHNNIDSIEEMLRNVLPKMKLGGHALHQYADWEKLDAYG